MSARLHSIRTNASAAYVLACSLSLAAFAPAPLAAQEAAFVIDPTVLSPSSPRQWVYDGAEAVEGPLGMGISLSSTPKDYPKSALRVSFDEDTPADSTGLWSVETLGPYVRSASARLGSGAGSFRAPDTKLVLAPGTSGAVFVPETPMGDFSIEFWLKPAKAESGEIVFLWKANRKSGKGWLPQQISCLILRNRLTLGFINFFADPAGKATNVSLQGLSVVVPGAWSHHIVSYDSATGLVEYRMDGKTEATAYATSKGSEGGTVWNAVAGSSGRLELAPNYTGLMDEFRLSSGLVDTPALARFPVAGGSATSPVYDLGATNSRLIAFESSSRTPAESAVHWSYRAADYQAGWTGDSPAWLPFAPAAELASASGGAVRGRYVQVRAMLYPDASGEQAPSVMSLRLRYEPDRAPPPPARVSAVPSDGRVTVRWSRIAESDVRGYVVYYGVASGDYFGKDAAEGPSPIFVRGADTTSLTINGLKNGTLYFIAVAAFDAADEPHIGEFSRELTARPSRISP